MNASTAVCTSLVLLLFVGAAPTRAAASLDSAPPPQHDHGTVAPPPAALATPAAVPSPDAEIARLLAAMNTAQGDAKVALMADLIARLVSERRPASAGTGECSMCAAKMTAKMAARAAEKTASAPAAPASTPPNGSDSASPRAGCAMMASK